MSNRTEAAQRKLRQLPPGDYRYCACSRLYKSACHGPETGFEEVRAQVILAE
jgi:hypothetical protein